MAEDIVEDEIPAPLPDVWAVVSDFLGFITAQGVPVESEGSGIGMTRTLTFGSARFVERLESLDEATHTTSYSLVKGPMPAKDYVGTIHLEAAGDKATRIVWSGTFEPIGDADPGRNLEGVYRNGIAFLHKHFSAGA
jgi:hypothetical protein